MKLEWNMQNANGNPVKMPHFDSEPKTMLKIEVLKQRRISWNMIYQFSRHRSIVLTSITNGQKNECEKKYKRKPFKFTIICIVKWIKKNEKRKFQCENKQYFTYCGCFYYSTFNIEINLFHILYFFECECILSKKS